jgi:hypothetical protein
MSDDRWRTRLRWVVVHPHDPAVLLARRDGVLALPETERPGQVWTADPAEVLPALGELLGADALLLDCLDDHQDPAAGCSGRPCWPCPGRRRPRPRGWPGWVGPAWPAPVPATPPWPPGWSRSWSAAPAGTAASLGGPRLVRRGRPLAALDHGAPRPAPHRAGAPGPGLAALLSPARPHRRRRRLVQGQHDLAPVRQRGGGHGRPGRAVPRPGAGPAGRRARTGLDGAGRLRRGGRLGGAHGGGRRGGPDLRPHAGRGHRRPARRRRRHLAVARRGGRPPSPPPPPPGPLRRAGPATPSRPRSSTATCTCPTWSGGRGLSVLRLDRRLCGPPVPRPGHDPAGTAFVDAADEAELRERLRQAYLPEWASFEPPGRLARAWELAAPLGALHRAVSYRSLATRPPGDPHMAQSTAWWLRQVLAGLA